MTSRRICAELARMYPDIYERVYSLLLQDGLYKEAYCAFKARMSMRAAFPEKYAELWSKYNDDPPTDELPFDV